jgi:hypothetical protein
MPQKSIFKNLAVIPLLLIFAFALSSCEKETQVVGGGEDDNNNNNTILTTVKGQVINEITSAPIDSVAVTVWGGESPVFTITDTQGKFTADVELSGSLNISIVLYKSGYDPDSVSVFATAGTTLNVPLISLSPVSTSGGGQVPSGDPVSIFLFSQSSDFIGVKESGAEETARLVFVVQDSAGNPIDLNHSVDVNFKFGAGPNGGEALSPTIVKTNIAGLAPVNLTSGVKAGVVQIIAEINFGNKKITSLPVAISIHGGLPDFAHFSIAPVLRNFPGYNIYGLKDQIAAYVGDKYGNPVRPQTSVYFTTTGGIIVGSTTTDAQGLGSVDLISADPKPTHPLLGVGFATVTATTADETSTNISKETIVLFSGIPEIRITSSTTSLDLPNGGSQSFTYYVGDQNGNPLAGGTGISVSANGEDVDVQGDVDIELPDTQNKGWTTFGFTVYDTNDSINVLKPVSVNIKTSGPNGIANLTLSGVKR